MYNTSGFDFVLVREMGLEIYALVILCSLTSHVVKVNAQSDFRDDTSVPKGNNLPWFTYDINNFLFPTSHIDLQSACILLLG